jgi:HAD superfamily hydrolase (TIGR01484 family)
MKPVASLSPEQALGLRALAFDLDDTLLDAGRLGEAAYSALFRLREAGLRLVAITGRPSGWGEVIARQWPIDGAITENGAVACASAEGRLEVMDSAGAARGARRARLEGIVRQIRAAHPELRPSDDVHARRSDYTFDVGEHQQVPAEVVSRVRADLHALGARTIVSSVHLHATLDGLDKASGAARFFAERFGWDSTESLDRVAFIGDSENDEACFSAFRTTIAVANFRGRPTVPPRFVTSHARGAGFAEAAAVLVARRAGQEASVHREGRRW